MAAPVTRLPDWQHRLQAWLQAATGQPMRYGHFDCGLFGAGAVEAQTGVDLAAPFRGRYTTFRGGIRVLRRAGYRDHVDLIARHLREIHPITALPGDIAAVPDADGRPAVALVQGSAVYVLAPAGGFGFAPLTEIQRLFKVG